MKKTVAAAIAAALVLTTSAVFAAPVEFNGEVGAQYRWNTYNTTPDEASGGKYLFRLNATMELDKNVSVYGRLAGEKLTGQTTSQPDYNSDIYGRSIFTLDQYGIVIKDGEWNYKIGRQGVAITPTALLYSSGWVMGDDMSLLTGIVATGKVGETSLQVVAGNQDFDANNNSNRVYSVHGSYSPAKDWKVGGTLAKYEPKGGATDKNFWGVDASYTAGKASFIADYLKSDADTQNDALIAGVDYAFDDKNTVSVYSHKTKDNAHIFTDWDSNQKGFYYIYNHNFDKTTAFSLFYKDNKQIVGTKENTSLRTTVTYKF